MPPLRKWTLILGQNGCGKSTLLRAIALVLAGSDALSELIDDVDSWIRVGAEEGSIAARLRTVRGQIRDISLRFRRGLSLREFFDHNRESLDLLDSALEYTDRSYLTIGYGVSRRISAAGEHRSRDSMRRRRARCVATLFRPEAQLHPLDAWAMDLDYRKGAEGLAVIRRSLHNLLPGVRLKDIDKEGRELLFSTPDGVVPLSQLSDGYQNVAAWCGDLLYRITDIFPDHKNPLNARALLLIDEIDLHLHPLWQRRLFDFLSSKLKNCQILATTHSPLTAQQAADGEFFVLRRTSARSAARLDAFAGVPAKMLVHQILTSPAFGLDTLDSPQVVALRREYRQLKDKEQPSSREKDRLAALVSTLEELPQWHADTPGERSKQALFEKIAIALEKGDA